MHEAVTTDCTPEPSLQPAAYVVASPKERTLNSKVAPHSGPPERLYVSVVAVVAPTRAHSPPGPSVRSCTS